MGMNIGAVFAMTGLLFHWRETRLHERTSAHRQLSLCELDFVDVNPPCLLHAFSSNALPSKT